jgi:hypothetical protein
MKRLRGYGTEESQEDWELKNDLARWESVSEVSGEEFVGGRRREVDIVIYLVIVAVVIVLSSSARPSGIPINTCNIAEY